MIPQRHRTKKKELSRKGQLSGEDERLLIQRVKAGDQKAFEAIFNHYVSSVHHQAFKLVANKANEEDVVQEVFL